MLIASLHLPAYAQEEIVIDAIAASVDGKPITLQDVSRKLKSDHTLTLRELSSDPEARAALEYLIFEKLLLQEAEAKKVAVTNSEIDDYINEVAARNNLSREGFEAALISQNKNLDEYKQTLKLDILRSKLTSNFVKDSVSVSDAEIDAYLEVHPELSKSGAKVKLRQILVSTSSHDDEEAHKLILDIRAKVVAGENFVEMARAHSEGTAADEGGLLGVLAEEDLSREIFDAVFSLKDGEVSEIIRTPAGYHIFMVESRFVEDRDDGNEKVREEIRKSLLNQKMQEKMQGFFTTEIYKLHTVDKKV